MNFRVSLIWRLIAVIGRTAKEKWWRTRKLLKGDQVVFFLVRLTIYINTAMFHGLSVLYSAVYWQNPLKSRSFSGFLFECHLNCSQYARFNDIMHFTPHISCPESIKVKWHQNVMKCSDIIYCACILIIGYFINVFKFSSYNILKM